MGLEEAEGKAKSQMAQSGAEGTLLFHAACGPGPAAAAKSTGLDKRRDFGKKGVTMRKEEEKDRRRRRRFSANGQHKQASGEAGGIDVEREATKAMRKWRTKGGSGKGSRRGGGRERASTCRLPRFPGIGFHIECLAAGPRRGRGRSNETGEPANERSSR